MSKTASDNTAFIVASIRSMADAEAGELLSGAERDARALLAAGKKADAEEDSKDREDDVQHPEYDD